MYLVSYNLAQFLGWSFVMLHLLPELGQLVKTRRLSPSLREECGGTLIFLQVAMYLEFVHCVVGLVRSNPVLTFMQVTSRVFVIALTQSFMLSDPTPAYWTMLFAWAATEMIRYSFYALNLLGIKIFLLTYIRYTFFIVLYPVGTLSELVCVYSLLPAIKASESLSIGLPNPANFTFNFYYFILVCMVGYLPGFPQLYGYMFKQRSKVLKKE